MFIKKFPQKNFAPIRFHKNPHKNPHKILHVLPRFTYKVLRAIISVPPRLLYENIYGTTITPIEEISYIFLCFSETLKIILRNYYEKFFDILYERLCIWL